MSLQEHVWDLVKPFEARFYPTIVYSNSNFLYYYLFYFVKTIQSNLTIFLILHRKALGETTPSHQFVPTVTFNSHQQRNPELTDHEVITSFNWYFYHL